jgi:hypothetical protein
MARERTSSSANAQTTIAANTDVVDPLRLISTGSREQILVTYAFPNTAIWALGCLTVKNSFVSPSNA